jgi:hypothetical protein
MNAGLYSIGSLRRLALTAADGGGREWAQTVYFRAACCRPVRRAAVLFRQFEGQLGRFFQAYHPMHSFSYCFFQKSRLPFFDHQASQLAVAG